ncbi:DMT family transporter [Miniphocaeibacter massiliensis]|uniref:DMT family transporter n=1 Tax=Miniphocaeibacter massiliensis TaxID=2041841 RepID=UPI000C1C1CE7|nr:DMT family transporter [Miniphocaeibacter massiliensis]
MEKLFKQKKFYIPMTLLVTFLWGSAFPALKISYEVFEIPQMDYFAKVYFAGIRFFIAGLIVLIYMKIFVKEKINFKILDYKFLIILATLQIILQYTFYYIGLGNTTGVKSAILQSSSAFIIVILSSILFKDDKLNKYKVIAIIVGLFGIVVTNINAGFDFQFKFTGEGFLFLAALFSGLGTVYVKAKGGNTNPFITTCAQMLIGSVVLMIIGRLGTDISFKWTGKGIALLLYSGFLSATAFALWYTILKYNKAGEVSVYMLFIPIFGTILSTLFLPGENFTINIFMGLTLVVLGTSILNLDKG